MLSPKLENDTVKQVFEGAFIFLIPVAYRFPRLHTVVQLAYHLNVEVPYTKMGRPNCNASEEEGTYAYCKTVRKSLQMRLVYRDTRTCSNCRLVL